MGPASLHNPDDLDGMHKTDNELAVRLVTIDSYMTEPHPDFDATYSHFQRKACQQVPVVRVFGATPEGKKACVHIHQAFPHFYVPVDRECQHDEESAASFGLRLAVAIESALQATSPMQHQHVYSWSITKAVPFYGYHPFPQFFVKFQLFRPEELSRIATILQSGGILGRRLQPYESHIPFLLQVMVERNLVGMGMVRFQRASPRAPLKGCSSASGGDFHSSGARRAGLFGWESGTHTRPGRQWGMPWGAPRSSAALALQSLERSSLCELEMDALVDDILNGADVVEIPLQQAGEDVRMVPSLAPIWEDEARRTGTVPPVPQLSSGSQRFPVPLSDHDRALRAAVYELARMEGLVPPQAAAGTPPESSAGPQAAPLDLSRPYQQAAAERGFEQQGLSSSEAPVRGLAGEASARDQGGADLLAEVPPSAQGQDTTVGRALEGLEPSASGGKEVQEQGYPRYTGSQEQAAEQGTQRGSQQEAEEGALSEELLDLLSWIAEEGEEQGLVPQRAPLVGGALGVPQESPWSSGALGPGMGLARAERREEEEMAFEGGPEGDPEVLSQREAAWAVAAADGVPEVALERARERLEECSQREWEQIADCVEDIVQEWEAARAAGKDAGMTRGNVVVNEAFDTGGAAADSVGHSDPGGDAATRRVTREGVSSGHSAPGGDAAPPVHSEGGSRPVGDELLHGVGQDGRHTTGEQAVRVIPQFDGAFDSSQGTQSVGEVEGDANPSVHSEGGSGPAVDAPLYGERQGLALPHEEIHLPLSRSPTPGPQPTGEQAARVIPQVDGAFDSSQGTQSAGEGTGGGGGEGREEEGGEGVSRNRNQGQQGIRSSEFAHDTTRGKRIRVEDTGGQMWECLDALPRQGALDEENGGQRDALDDGNSGHSSSAHSEEMLPGMPGGGRSEGMVKDEGGSQPRPKIAPPRMPPARGGLQSSRQEPRRGPVPLQGFPSGMPSARHKPGEVKQEQGATSRSSTLRLASTAHASLGRGGARGEPPSSGRAGAGAAAASASGRADRRPKRKEAGSNTGSNARGNAGALAGGNVGESATGAEQGFLGEAGTSVRDLMRMRRLRRRTGSSRSGEAAPGGMKQPRGSEAGATSGDIGVCKREPAVLPPASRISGLAPPGRAHAGGPMAHVSSGAGLLASGGAGGAPGSRIGGGRRERVQGAGVGGGSGGGMQGAGQGPGLPGLASIPGGGPEPPHTPLDAHSYPRAPSTASALSAPAGTPLVSQERVTETDRQEGEPLLMQDRLVKAERQEGAPWVSEEGAPWVSEEGAPWVSEDRLNEAERQEGAPWVSEDRGVKVEVEVLEGAPWVPEYGDWREEAESQEGKLSSPRDRAVQAEGQKSAPSSPRDKTVQDQRQEGAPSSSRDSTLQVEGQEGAPPALSDRLEDPRDGAPAVSTRRTGEGEAERPGGAPEEAERPGGTPQEAARPDGTPDEPERPDGTPEEAERLDGTPEEAPLAKDGSAEKGDCLPQSPPVDAPVSSSRGGVEVDQRMACGVLAVYDSERAGASSIHRAASVQLVYHRPPPSAEQVQSTWPEFGMEEVQWTEAHYSNAKDLPERPVIFGGKRFDVRLRDRTTLPSFHFGAAGPRSAAARALDAAQQRQQARERRALRGQASASENQPGHQVQHHHPHHHHHHHHHQQQQQQQQQGWEWGSGEQGQRGAAADGEAAGCISFTSPVSGLAYHMSPQGRVTYQLSPFKPPPPYSDVRSWVRRNPKPHSPHPAQPFAWPHAGFVRSRRGIGADGEGQQQETGFGASGEEDRGGESRPHQVSESQAYLRRDILPEARRFLSSCAWSSGDFGDDTYEDSRGPALGEGGEGERGGERGGGRGGMREEEGEDEEAEREWRDARPPSPKFDESYLFFTPPVAPRYTRGKPGKPSPAPGASRVRRRSSLGSCRRGPRPGPEGGNGRALGSPDSAAPTVGTPQGRSPLSPPGARALGTPQGMSPLSPRGGVTPVPPLGGSLLSPTGGPTLVTPQRMSPLSPPGAFNLSTQQLRSPFSPPHMPPGGPSPVSQARSPFSPSGMPLPLEPGGDGNRQQEIPAVLEGSVRQERNDAFRSPEAVPTRGATSLGGGSPVETSATKTAGGPSRGEVRGPSVGDSDEKQQMPPPSNYKRKPLTSPPPLTSPLPLTTPQPGTPKPPNSGAPPGDPADPAQITLEDGVQGKGKNSSGVATSSRAVVYNPTAVAERAGHQESDKATVPASKSARQAKKKGASEATEAARAAARARAAAVAAAAAAAAAVAGGKRQRKDMSQITPPKAFKVAATPLSQAGIKYKQKHAGSQSSAAQHLTILCIESHACSRGQLRPDPQQDAVALVAMAIQGARAPYLCTPGAPERVGEAQEENQGCPQAQADSAEQCNRRECLMLAVASGPAPTLSVEGPSLGLGAPSGVVPALSSLGASGPAPALGSLGTSGPAPASGDGSSVTRVQGDESTVSAGVSAAPGEGGGLLAGEGLLNGRGGRIDDTAQERRDALAMPGGVEAQGPAVEGSKDALVVRGGAERREQAGEGSKVALPGDTRVHWVDSEEELFTELVRLIQCLDPDIVTGWDIQAESLGYLAERALRLGQGSLLKALSRTPNKSMLRNHGLVPCLRCAAKFPVHGKTSFGLVGGGGAGGKQALGRDGGKANGIPKGHGSDGGLAQAGVSEVGTPVGRQPAPDEGPREEAADPGQSPVLSPGLTPDFPALSPSPLGASQGADARQSAGYTQGGSQDFLRSFAAVGAEAQALLAAQAPGGGQQRAPPQHQQHQQHQHQQHNAGASLSASGLGLLPSGDSKIGASHNALPGNNSRGALAGPGVPAEDAGGHWGVQKKVAGVGVGGGGGGAGAGAPPARQGRGSRQEAVVSDEWGRTQGSGLYVEGRIVLNLWRIFRSEIKLPIYTFESVAEAVLLRQVPKYDWPTLSAWYARGGTPGRWRCMAHFASRGQLCLDMMEQLDFASRTAELARVFGIDFFSVINRGSQFRVESMMMRLAHTQGYLLLSPSRMQVSTQPAMECIPLVMEPESALYTDPVVVLDFQSLYPSLVIAYNLCFSTCLGRLSSANPKKLGVSQYHNPIGVFSQLKDDLLLLPNGVMYVPPAVRKGVLPRLLNEILTTRVMVKQAMKKVAAKASNRVVHRVLNARQLALKLIANVTYGYTAAGFSGRMPCAELADSIVQAGRVTLERAIALVNSHPAWRARVVYGDTDSLFVLLKGRSREEAFRIGGEIVEEVSRANPPPVTLKLEKVYQPCILQTKKRYVGYAYESPLQCTPTFDAKGIETVRRDSCPVVAKTLESCLRILFESKDLSLVKAHIVRQWQRILSNRAPLRDFIFAKEVRLGSYSANAATLPPAAVVATKAMAKDPRAEPKYGERVPYVVVYRDPGARLVDMVVDPMEILDQAPELRLHGTYYITKQIVPALHRVFALVGADVASWLAEMPRVHRPLPSKRVNPLYSRGQAQEVPSGHPGGATAAAGGGQGSTGAGAEGMAWARGDAMGVPYSAKGAGGRGRGGRGGSRGGARGGGTIDQYYASKHCAVCGALTRGAGASSAVPLAYRQHTPLCPSCSASPELVVLVLQSRASKLHRDLLHLNAICHHCGSGVSPTANPSLKESGGRQSVASRQVACVSLNCPVFFERKKVCAELQPNIFDF